MTQKTQGTVSIVAAVLVLFCSMWDPEVSIIIAVVALALLGVWELVTQNNFPAPEEGSGGATSQQTAMKQEHLSKVLEMLGGQNEISNDQVQAALGVSDATATRYLQELENQGKLVQVGSRGRQVIYRKV